MLEKLCFKFILFVRGHKKMLNGQLEKKLQISSLFITKVVIHVHVCLTINTSESH